MPAALFNVPARLGYLALAALVGGESMGVPLPGETALIAASLLARRGDMAIELVVAIAAAAAVVGDNVGYLIGRRGGRRLLLRRGPFERQRRELIDRGERFFARHGAKAVFLGRWFAGLRITAAWLAGIHHMPWRTFLLWNALGGVLWALTVGLLAFWLGHAVEAALETGGLIGAGVVVAVATLALVWWRRLERREDG
ncbi:MAG: DedA family protein [Thermoleophilaceae bacterium]|nr:DedA family protein [Thermoleophilaceae bacterium]